MSNIIDSIQLSGVTYGIKGSGGTETIELTQAQYDALVDKDPNVFYIITDATAGDLSNYYTKSETSGATEIQSALDAKADTATTYTKTEVDNAITAATSTKQDTLVSGTNIKTINNESILGSGNINIQGGGGGKAISGGTNISITTGETADTINCTLPITTAIDNTSLNFGFNTINSEVSYSFGNANTVGRSRYNGSYSMAVGLVNTTNAEAQFVTGYNNKLLNPFEFGSGHFNNSVLASTTFGDSGNTLFSVGNGTEEDARHNAFEIRQNGDIYLSLNGQDVKLQDQLGGGGMDDNTQQLIATSLVDLNDRKADKSLLSAYATKSSLDAKANASEVMTLAKATENEKITASALNELNNRIKALEEAIQALQNN